MAIANVHKAIYSILTATNFPVSNGMRVAGTATPCIVYELTSAELAVHMLGASALNVWTVGIQVVAVADTVDLVCDVVDTVQSRFESGPVTDAGEALKIQLTQFSVAFSTENPDDGQHDAERIGTIAITILAQEY